MKRSIYRERDYAFGQTFLALRTTIGLTQADLARRLGLSRKAVGEWEAGETYPTAEHLKAVIALAVGHQAWPAGARKRRFAPSGKRLTRRCCSMKPGSARCCPMRRHRGHLSQVTRPVRLPSLLPEEGPEGKHLASGGYDGSVILWEAATGTQLARLQGHRGMVMCVTWSPDGTRLASGGGGRGSGELFVWDARTGVYRREPLPVLRERSEIVYALAWSPTGTMLISGGSDGMLRWWDVERGECVQTRQAHQGTVQSLKANPDGRLLASCGDDGAIIIWDLASGEHLCTLRRDRPYERLDIGGVKGLTQAQRSSLCALGAIESDPMSGIQDSAWNLTLRTPRAAPR